MNQMQHDFKGSPVAQQDYGPILGTPFKVYLMNGARDDVDASTGKPVTEIKDVPGLLAAIVQSRVLHPRKLSGHDLKYIRSALCLKSHEVASALDLTPEHYSRCETGTKTLSPEKEKFYRMYVFLGSIFKDRGVKARLSKESIVEESRKADSPEKAQKAMEAFSRIFFEMKLDLLYLAGDDLEFTFSRRAYPNEGKPCGDDDGNWLNEENLEAA